MLTPERLSGVQTSKPAADGDSITENSGTHDSMDRFFQTNREETS
jgi:hypothetical protein